MQRTSTIRTLGALLLLLALLGAACSNEDSTSTGAGDGEAGQEGGPFADLERIAAPDPCELNPGVSESQIKVGAIAPESGAAASSFAPALEGIKARFEMANQEGELGERELVLVPADDASDAARNAEAARRLVESEKVFGIIEVSDKAAGSADYLADAGIPVTGWHVGVPAWSIHPNMFTFRQPASADPQAEYTDRYVRLLKEIGGSKIALVAGGNESSVTFVNRIEKTFEKVGGAEIVYKTTDVVIGTTEFTAVVQRIKESGADVLITGMALLQNTALSNQLRQAGVEMTTTIFPGGYDPRVTGIEGIEGATFGLEFKPLELQKEEGTKSFADYDKYLPEDQVRGQVTYVGWLAANLFIEGIKQAGAECPTREAFIANLRLLEGYTADGAFDEIDFREDFGHEFPCSYYVSVEKGEFVPLFDGKQFCGERVAF